MSINYPVFSLSGHGFLTTCARKATKFFFTLLAWHAICTSVCSSLMFHTLKI